MNFALTPEQEAWRAAVRRFAEKELAPRVAQNDEAQTFPRDVIPKMAELKLWGVFVPEEYGGAGGTNMDWVIMMEEIGRVDAAAITTTAMRRGDHYILNGTKSFITNAGVARIYVVLAKTEPQKGARGVSAFVVPADAPGFSIGKIENKLGVRSSMTGELIFEDCAVPAENLLGIENAGFGRLMDVFAIERAGNSAIAVGTAQAAMEAAIRYTKERPAFGKHVSDFQGVQWMLADMAVEIEAARLLTRQGADLADRGLPNLEQVAMGKVLSNEMCMRVTVNAVQLLGAAGYTKDFPVERYMRDAKIFAIGGGATQIQRTIIARGLLK